MLEEREQQIIDFVKKAEECSSKEVFEGISTSVSYATLKRILTKLIAENYIETKGQGKGNCCRKDKRRSNNAFES